MDKLFVTGVVVIAIGAVLFLCAVVALSIFIWKKVVAPNLRQAREQENEPDEKPASAAGATTPAPKKGWPWWGKVIMAWVLLGGISTLIGIGYMVKYPNADPHYFGPGEKRSSAQPPYCDDAWQHVQNHFSDSIGDFIVPVTDGCQGGWITLPDSWKNWDKQFVSNGDDCLIWFHFANEENARGPYTQDTIPHDFHTVAPTRFRVDTNCPLRIFSND